MESWQAGRESKAQPSPVVCLQHTVLEVDCSYSWRFHFLLSQPNKNINGVLLDQIRSPSSPASSALCFICCGCCILNLLLQGQPIPHPIFSQGWKWKSEVMSSNIAPAWTISGCFWFTAWKTCFYWRGQKTQTSPVLPGFAVNLCCSHITFPLLFFAAVNLDWMSNHWIYGWNLTHSQLSVSNKKSLKSCCYYRTTSANVG